MAWKCKLCGWDNGSDASKCVSCGKRKPRAKKGPLPRSDAAHRCVILSLDTANITGWCVRVGGIISSHGEHKLYTDSGMSETNALLGVLETMRDATGLPIVAVSERSWGGHLGMGATMAFGYWVHALRSIDVPMKRIIEVYPSSWRSIVLGSKFATAKRDIVRPEEMRAAKAIVGERDIGNDEAPAILIGEWASCAGEVGAVL